MLTHAEYRQLVEQAPIMIWRADTSAGCDYFNERWTRFTGRALADELGGGWAAGVHPDDLDRCLAIYRAHFDRRRTFEMEFRLRRHDGEYRWISDRGVPSYDEAGTFAGYVGSCVDITDRVSAEQELARLREDQIRSLEELLPICASCKRVRDDRGYWHRVERYLEERGAAAFTHTFCPSCEREMG